MQRYVIPSVYQAIRLYRLLIRAERGMSSLELEGALKLPRSTIFRLLKTLLSQNLIAKNGTRFYVDSRLHTMGIVPPTIQKYQNQLASPLAELIEHTPHMALLCIPATDSALVLDVVCMNSASMAQIRPGIRLSLLDSAPGHIMLAYQSDYSGMFQTATSEQEWDALRVEKITTQTCTRGYAISSASNAQQVLVAVPVLSKSGSLVAMLSLLLNGINASSDADDIHYWTTQLKLIASMPARGCFADKDEAG